MQMITSTSTPSVGSTFRYAMPVRWGDLDALNHVNNTVYFRYFEEARVQLFSVAGVVRGSDKDFVVAHISCDFLKPLMYPATVIVIQELIRIGRTSIEMNILLEREDEPGVLYAKGRYVLVGTDGKTGKSSAWTDQEHARLAELMTAA